MSSTSETVIVCNREVKLLQTNEVYVYDNNKLIGYGGLTSKTPLSNFYKTDFTYKNILWNCSEAAIMYEKACCFNDNHVKNEILKKHDDPGIYKKLGRKVTNFEPSKWISHRNIVVKNILYEKFKQSDHLKRWLLNTGDAILAEISKQSKDGKILYYNVVWGIKLGPYDNDIEYPETWNNYGDNFLGITLMEVRKMLEN